MRIGATCFVCSEPAHKYFRSMLVSEEKIVVCEREACIRSARKSIALANKKDFGFTSELQPKSLRY